MIQQITRIDESFAAKNKMEPDAKLGLSLSGIGPIIKATTNLRCIILINQTSTDFVTSDDPVIHTNRYQLQRLSRNSFGFGSAGTILLLPLNARLMLLCYDPFIYFVPSLRGLTIKIGSVEEIEALNSFQFIRASNNIYFGNWNSANSLIETSQKCSEFRIDEFVKVTLLQHRNSDQKGDYFISVNEGDPITEKRIILHTRSLFPLPPQWFSTLKWHPNPKYITKGISDEHLRPELTSHRGSTITPVV